MSFSPVRIVANERAATTLHHIVIDLGTTGIADGYLHAGQFVQLGAGSGKPGFYAIASAPKASERQMEFLIKYEGETSQAICALSPGDKLRCSPVMGKGFPLNRVEGRDLLLFATGSGISAIRSVIESGIGEDRRVRLYYGARTPAHMAYADKFQSWEEAGVRVHPVISRPDDCDWDGLKGYIQNAYQTNPIDASSAAAVFCGLSEMVNEAKEILSAAGMPSDRFLFNY